MYDIDAMLIALGVFWAFIGCAYGIVACCPHPEQTVPDDSRLLLM